MELHEIEVTIEKDGQVRIHVQGVKGDNCFNLTRPLEEALGNDVIERKMTLESQENPVELDQTLTVKQKNKS
jgi:hypothetical protein